MLIVMSVIIVGFSLILVQDKSNTEVSKITKDIREESESLYPESELKDIPFKSVYTEKEEDRGF